MAAIRAFLVTVLVGEICLTAIILTAIILVFRGDRQPANRNMREISTMKAEVIASEPVHVITSAPARSLPAASPAPARSEGLGIEPPAGYRVYVNGAPYELVPAARGRIARLRGKR